MKSLYIKALLISATLLFSGLALSDKLVYQVVNDELSITPEMVNSVELVKDANSKKLLKITLKESGLEKLNALILNSYGKKLNILFDNKIVTLSMPIQLFEFPSQEIYISSSDPDALEKMSQYLKK